MRASKIACFGLFVFTSISGCTTGYDKAEIDMLLSPATIQDLRTVKSNCEKRHHRECAIIGTYIPKINGDAI